MSLQRLRTERDSLKETIEELRCVQAQEGQLTTQGKNISVAQPRLFLTVSVRILDSSYDIAPVDENEKLVKRP